MSDVIESKENKDLTRKEEPTKAPTPDKLDRAARGPAAPSDDTKPYPLTEEEATPNAAVHERDHSIPESTAKATPKDSSKQVAEDYNRVISPPDEKN